MSLKEQKDSLQTGVDFMAIGQPGAINGAKPNSIRTYEYGTTMLGTDVFIFGGAAVLDTDGGVRLPDTGDTVADIQGFVVFQNTGVIENSGYQKDGIFYNVPVCELGEIILPVKSGETIAIGDDVALYIGAGDDFNTIEKLPGAPGADDITLVGKVRVAKPSREGYVVVTLIQYSN